MDAGACGWSAQCLGIAGEPDFAAGIIENHDNQNVIGGFQRVSRADHSVSADERRIASDQIVREKARPLIIKMRAQGPDADTVVGIRKRGRNRCESQKQGGKFGTTP